MAAIDIKQKLLSQNAQVAAELRAGLRETGTLTLNITGSPGAGKTAFLERTLQLLPEGMSAAVLTANVQIENDAARLERCGFPVRRVAPAEASRPDAGMVMKHLRNWDIGEVDLLFIENAGNRVCDDLGEDATVAVLSVAEGDDTPLKYPGIYGKAELMILNKIDLLPYVPFLPELAWERARQFRPDIGVIEISSLAGSGFDRWLFWLRARLQAKRNWPLSPAMGLRLVKA